MICNQRIERPKVPISPLRTEGSFRPLCPKCTSTMMHKKFIFFGKSPGCIHPDCENYGGPNG